MAFLSQELSTMDAARLEKQVTDHNQDGLFDDVRDADGCSTHGGEDILASQDMDPALNMKMHLVNNVSEKTVVVARR